MAVPDSACWTNYWYWLAAPHVPRGLLHGATDSMPYAADVCVCRYTPPRKSLAPPQDANRKFFCKLLAARAPAACPKKKDISTSSSSLPLFLSLSPHHLYTLKLKFTVLNLHLRALSSHLRARSIQLAGSWLSPSFPRALSYQSIFLRFVLKRIPLK